MFDDYSNWIATFHQSIRFNDLIDQSVLDAFEPKIFANFKKRKSIFFLTNFFMSTVLNFNRTQSIVVVKRKSQIISPFKKPDINVFEVLYPKLNNCLKANSMMHALICLFTSNNFLSNKYTKKNSVEFQRKTYSTATFYLSVYIWIVYVNHWCCSMVLLPHLRHISEIQL